MRVPSDRDTCLRGQRRVAYGLRQSDEPVTTTLEHRDDAVEPLCVQKIGVQQKHLGDLTTEQLQGKPLVVRHALFQMRDVRVHDPRSEGLVAAGASVSVHGCVDPFLVVDRHRRQPVSVLAKILL
jgi:hypothetical protein